MPAEPQDPFSPPPSVGPAASAAPIPDAAGTERFGPLRVMRHVKEDGRALTLYERIEDDRGRGG